MNSFANAFVGVSSYSGCCHHVHAINSSRQNDFPNPLCKTGDEKEVVKGSGRGSSLKALRPGN